jgi:hypothetical protein
LKADKDKKRKAKFHTPIQKVINEDEFRETPE